MSSTSAATSPMNLITYKFDFGVFEKLQQQIRLPGPGTEADQKATYEQLSKEFEKMSEAAKELFIAHTKCTRCGSSPLVTGSVHETMLPHAEANWKEVEKRQIGLASNVDKMKQADLNDLKSDYEDAEKIYLKDNVAVKCTAPLI